MQLAPHPPLPLTSAPVPSPLPALQGPLPATPSLPLTPVLAGVTPGRGFQESLIPRYYGLPRLLSAGAESLQGRVHSRRDLGSPEQKQPVSPGPSRLGPPSAISVPLTKGKERLEEKFMVSSAECWAEVT